MRWVGSGSLEILTSYRFELLECADNDVNFLLSHENSRSLDAIAVETRSVD